MKPLILFATVTVALGASRAARAQCESVELTTYNTAFVVFPASTEDNFHMSAARRAREIARNLLAGDADVIALQEVFDSDAADVFEDMLAPAFPFYVKYLDTDGVDVEGDSGLMLFSKFPFLEFDDTTYARDLVAFASGRPWAAVKFATFYQQSFPDNLADKGVGLVKIQGPCERQLAVAFTHMQASYDGDTWDDVKVRDAQLNTIASLLLDLSPAERERAEIYVLGDLNIDGNPVTAHPWGNETEWQMHFDPNTPGLRFFKDFVTDSRPSLTSADDLGLSEGAGMPTFTEPDSGHRYDYLLRHDVAGPTGLSTCVQHLTIDHAVGVHASGTSLSDHLPLTASTHLAHPFCDPPRALVAPLPDAWLSAAIEQPGMMQWFRIAEEGSYTIELFGAPGLDFDVYTADDLSRPVVPYHGEASAHGFRFVLPAAPFFVRVHGDGAATGFGTLHVHRNQGGSPDDSIGLQPAVPVHHQLPAWPLNWENATWFHVWTSSADSSALPTLGIGLRPDSWWFFTEIFDANLNPVRGWPQPPPGKYFVKVRPWVWWTPSGTGFELTYETDLTVASDLYVDCVSQDDLVGDDDVHLVLLDDGKDLLGGWRYLGEFDSEDDPHPLAAAGVGTQKFVDSLHVELWETDDGPSANDLLGAHDFATLPGPIAEDRGVKVEWRGWAFYRMRMVTSHDDPARCRQTARSGCVPSP